MGVAKKYRKRNARKHKKRKLTECSQSLEPNQFYFETLKVTRIDNDRKQGRPKHYDDNNPCADNVNNSRSAL